jgi:hypothetical protein
MNNFIKILNKHNITNSNNWVDEESLVNPKKYRESLWICEDDHSCHSRRVWSEQTRLILDNPEGISVSWYNLKKYMKNSESEIYSIINTFVLI